MTLPIDYKDTVTIYKISVDGYSDDVIEDSAEVRAVVVNSTGFSHSDYQDQITTDARIYVDPENAWIQLNALRLEGMLVNAPMFGVESGRAWYKVTTVSIARDHLLTNSIDNIRLDLKKTKDHPNVS